MKETVSKQSFRDAFVRYGRGDQFSYDGLSALFDYLEELDDGCGEEMELDVIALCCDFTEYESADRAASEYFEYPGMEYGDDGEELESPEEVEEKALNFLRDRTTVIEFDGGVIIQAF